MSQTFHRSFCRRLCCWLDRELRMYAVARVVTLILVLSLLTLPGCSYFYDLFLEGQVLAGADQTPVSGAKVTLVIMNSDGATCVTDSQGRWELKDSLSDSWFVPGKDKKRWLKSDKIKLRIEAQGETYFVPCPRVALQDSYDCFGFVMTVLEIQPEPQVRELLPEFQPLEAVKPCHSDD
ncbi:MAG TPA: hypothetical protein DIT97_00645 [Gimesia maris]|uniref:Carboxypeptidase regulatory-like domain-containing protein n=1 Tax=Gimesia maris TaxID=122 RepID=A0A3D3R106_9PLAN|nr:hypothetical protein [Gimesia maris]